MKNKKCIIIIQARFDSKRLPGKVLSKIEDIPMLIHIINRMKKIDCCKTVVATTKRKIDDPIVNLLKKNNVEYFRGSKNDVLDRFFQTALKFQADIIIRITADCPLIDPIESKKVLSTFLKGKYDYISNNSKTYPNGLDTECFSFNALKRSWKEAKLKSEREHVTPYIWKNPNKFKINVVHNKNKNQLDDLKWSVDHENDLLLIKKIYSILYSKEKIFTMNEILKILKKYPRLKKINSKNIKNEGYLLSIKKDKK